MRLVFLFFIFISSNGKNFEEFQKDKLSQNNFSKDKMMLFQPFSLDSQ